VAVIFYFSGTGNSLSVAQKLSRELNARIEGISSYLKKPYPVDDELIGFVTPVYCYALPPLVKEFLQSAQFGEPKYVFGVATMGAMAGQTLSQASEILSQRGIKLQVVFKLALPDSSIVFPSPAKLKEKMLRAEEPAVAKIAKVVKKYEKNDSSSSFLFMGKLVEAIGWWVLKNIYKIEQKAAVVDKCISCGLCAKICPVGCIEMKNGHPVFGKNCANCFACAQWCPQNAIALGKLIPNEKTKYVHPGVTAVQMVGQKTKS